MDIETKRRSRSNISHAIDEMRRFPRNTFVKGWTDFLFFDSDAIFMRQFVETTKQLLEIEQSDCICMVNLDQIEDGKQNDKCCAFFSRLFTEEAYLSILRGPREGEGWINAINRFALISDLGQWCIYCERNNEIAVVGFQGHDSFLKIGGIFISKEALPISQAIEKCSSYAFSSRNLSPQWREEFIREYS